ncbi:uncharacterized protein YALI1_E12873g [Yarrowia lipolytica]|uniref:Uncharacterized protein n=1 Tax=Yarrowia lipolytica TaxID=4952 RepID=A0A1D8NHW2_YARLL|nr:hypothetical protein YALI1_E12873g [Yarrowia lipolytica]
MAMGCATNDFEQRYSPHRGTLLNSWIPHNKATAVIYSTMKPLDDSPSVIIACSYQDITSKIGIITLP